MNNDETVYVVDGDRESSDHVCALVHGMQLRCEVYALAQDFLESLDLARPGCVILEVRIADLSGLQLQEQLAEFTPTLPVVFLTAHASTPVIVRAIQRGAVNFLEKPANEQDLWDVIHEALQVDRAQRTKAAELGTLRQQLELLTEKELEVLRLLAQDKSTRAIARTLDISVRTVEFRRARMLQKLHFNTPLQLTRFALRVLDERPLRATTAEPVLPAGSGNGDGLSRTSLTSQRIAK